MEKVGAVVHFGQPHRTRRLTFLRPAQLLHYSRRGSSGLRFKSVAREQHTIGRVEQTKIGDAV